MNAGSAHAVAGEGLVYHAGGLGDFVLSLPAMARLAGACPDLRWHYWGPGERRLLLPGWQAPPPALLRSGHTLWGDAPAPEACEGLRGYTAVAAFGGASGVPWVERAHGWAVTLQSFPAEAGEPGWVPAFQRRQLDAHGVPRCAERWMPAWRRRVLGARVPRALVLHPGSGHPAKNLPATHWAAAAVALGRRTQLPVRLVLGPVEVERGVPAELAQVADEVCPCVSLAALLECLRSAALYLGNDGGASHLAAALGLPSVVVFGPSDPRRWRPLGAACRVVSGERPCAPCSGAGAINCGEHSCWVGFDPDRVVAAAAALLVTAPEAAVGRAKGGGWG